MSFAYGLAPGLDLRYADEDDAAALESKLAQVLGLGVRTLAVLFDDVPRRLRPEDAQRFGTLAGAQAAVANAVHAQLQAAGGEALLFCPTDYCGAMARPSVAESPYLRELGERLVPAIEVLWSGPEVISERITPSHAREVAGALRRLPLLWDNLHANDYDPRRLHLGPYAGRPAALKAEVAGILSNPNSECAANTVPLATLASYLRTDDYRPREAFLEAVAGWSDRFELAGGERLDPDELAFLADFLYLPFEHGPAAQAFLEDVAYLGAVPPAAWEGDVASVASAAGRLAGLLQRLAGLRDRELLASLHPYLLEVLGQVGAAARGLAARRLGAGAEAPRDGIANVRRGGFAGELERLLRAPRTAGRPPDD